MGMTYFSVVLCGALFIGVGIPIGIYLFARRGEGVAEFDVLSQLMRKSRQSWRADENLMQELSREVSKLDKNDSHDVFTPTNSAEDVNPKAREL
jgi:hypothetical protein